jgi:hypothetical protein
MLELAERRAQQSMRKTYWTSDILGSVPGEIILGRRFIGIGSIAPMRAIVVCYSCPELSTLLSMIITRSTHSKLRENFLRQGGTLRLFDHFLESLRQSSDDRHLVSLASLLLFYLNG